ncbi:uncharacterized protein LOC143578626 [Bidens hawaiensis]|uniref:uncharacterized protein LOC143578626 n=1 Tax=Bidens hawaiensis TaxID=980011 RepID=UPI00404A8250
MEFTLTLYRHHSQPLSLAHHRPPSFNIIAFQKSKSFSSITPKASIRINANPSSFLKTTFVTGVTLTVVFLSRFTVEPAMAAPPPATIESKSEIQEEEYHIKALKTLMENKIKNGKVQEAIGILNQLKYHLLSHGVDDEHPLRVEAYHAKDLKIVEKQIVDKMEISKFWAMNYYRDFKFALTLIRVIQGDYKNALKLYKELSYLRRDFKPYFCQEVIETLLGKNDDVENSFGFWRLLGKI